MIHIVVKDLPGAREHMAGATLGRAHAQEVVRRLPAIGAPFDAAVLDFEGTESATASYLKAFVFGLVRASQRGVLAMEPNAPRAEAPSDIPPLNCLVAVARLPADVVEELEEVCESQRVAVYEAVAWDEKRLYAVKLHGPVERALSDTLDAVFAAGPSSATSLHEAHPRVGISVTGWNNRLAELFRARLLLRDREGRQLVYAPVAREVHRG